jgi:flagellar biosynthesis/type III secretory pathway chaperone
MTRGIDPSVCRDTLGRLLSDEYSLLIQLERQLVREHALIGKGDIDGLEAVGGERQACVAALLKLEDERLGLCRMLGHSPDLNGLETLLRWCDPQAILRQALQDCTDLAGRCRDQNTRNGMLVNVRLQRVSGVLGLLTSNDATPASSVYGRKGNAFAAPTTAGRMLSFSA